MSALLNERLSFYTEKELTSLIRVLQSGDGPVFPSGMTEHFKIAKQKPERFRNHGDVLAISLGGTNTKVMLASMQNGSLSVEYVKALENPEEETEFHNYLNNLLFSDKKIRDYLTNHEHPCIGFSVPMSILNGVPFNKTKVPTLKGVITRDNKNQEEIPDLRTNVMNFLKSRNLNPTVFFYKSDGIVAHHGAVSLCEMEEQDKSVLLVCGTGLATGDEQNYIQIGIVPLLQGDQELYPRDVTEDYQYQYAIAGKGLFSLMKRAIGIKAAENDSLLGKFCFDKYFCTPKDSKTVVEIWESTLGNGKITGRVEEIYDMIGKDAYLELHGIADRIVNRAIASMAVCVVVTILRMGPAQNGRGHTVFFEGSLAVNPIILSKLKGEILKIISNKELFDSLGIKQPHKPFMDKKMIPMIMKNDEVKTRTKEVDLTLIGAATMVIAEDCILTL